MEKDTPIAVFTMTLLVSLSMDFFPVALGFPLLPGGRPLPRAGAGAGISSFILANPETFSGLTISIPAIVPVAALVAAVPGFVAVGCFGGLPGPRLISVVTP